MPDPTPSSQSSESVKTALVALAANLVVAIARLAAGLLTGSSSLLAEAAHGGADTINEVLLALSVRAARRPASPEHPFGYQGQRFLWAFVAAVVTFVVGGIVSVGLGVVELFGAQKDAASPIVGFVVIAVSFIADGVSFARGVQQARGVSASLRVPLVRLIVRTPDPILRAVVVEDGIALAGDVVATLGLGLRTVTGSDVPDAVGAVLVGVILTVAAVVLARILGDLLIGRGLPPRRLEPIRRAIEADGAVRRVLSISAIYLGPAAALVTAKVVPVGGMDSLALARRFSAIDRAVREASDIVVDVYLDPGDEDVETDAAVSPVLELPDD